MLKSMPRYAKFLLLALIATIFFTAGSAKLMAMPAMIAQFEHFGLPIWFMYITGVIEVLGGLLLIVPHLRIRMIGACLLTTTMAVGAGFHLTYDTATAAIPAVILMTLCASLAWNAYTHAQRIAV